MALGILLRRCDAPEGFLEPRGRRPSEDRGTPGSGSALQSMYLTSAFHEASTLALGFATGSSCVLGDPARLGPGSCRAHGLDIKLDSWDIVTIKA